ncbi:cholinesterase-like [Apostichopus japonicus]|uniref:cholinesterase-like n=1 Tax=Stichopus japonicus TaxID=307972 RepID=UPI003AB6557D
MMQKMAFLTLIAILVTSSFNLNAAQVDMNLVEVITGSGPITGYSYDYTVDSGSVQLNKTVDTFLGIPYAEPPIDDLRFRKPVPKSPWTDTLNATMDRPMCWQAPVELPGLPPQDEDCLYLNIWSPDVQLEGLPVMVWIHGGAFVFGSGSGPYYEGLPLAAFHDVVVVTLNYRLSVFGFLFANEASPGNYGIFDQNMAMRWVKDNIEAFGGDPNQITIFGQSAGGASVGIHLLAEQSQDLYNRAILMSGSMIHPWGVELDKAKALSDTDRLRQNVLQCRNVMVDQDFVECLRKRSAPTLILAALTTLAQVISINIPFVPLVDGDIIKENPFKLLDQGKFKQCDIMTGATKDDGSLVALLPFLLQIASDDPYANFTEFQSFLGESTYVYDTPQVNKAIEQEYVDWSMVDEPSTNYFETYVKLATDEAFYCPCDEVSRQFTKRGNAVYKYLFNHLPSRSIYSVIPTSDPTAWKWRGIAHAEDIPFVFGCPFRPNWPHDYTEEEELLSLDMMRYYANFAKTGNPNQGTSGTQATWEKFDLPELKLMNLKPNLEMMEGYHADHCHFWNDYVLKLVTFTADLEQVQDEWNMEFDRWRMDDVTQWRTEFDDHQKETDEFCQKV